ncbi:S-adenosylmethionine decarboxylase [Candidatus Pacearchaeota archaeon]|nr:S-adenosylmethionine decarboxylase [Candidatus Pacearchaeota archaeon]
MNTKPYGKELILDLHNCDPSTFTRKSIRNYFKKLCNLIDMERCELYWWDDYGVSPEEQQTEPHMKGTSAIQFISTSNITIHTLDLLENVYLNIFSCKEFDPDVVVKFSEEWFKGIIVNSQVINRV